MAEVIVFPDAVKQTVAELRTQAVLRSDAVLSGVTFTHSVEPGTSPTRQVWVRRVGGLADDLVFDEPRLDFLVWHDTPEQAMALAQLVRAIVRSRRGLKVGTAQTAQIDDVLGPTPVPDPSNPARDVVMFTLAVQMRGTAS